MSSIGRIWLWPTQHGPMTVLRRALSRDAKARADGAPLRRLAEPARGTTHRFCQWIEGPPAGPATRFCAAPVRAGCSWCEAHAARAFQPKAEERF